MAFPSQRNLEINLETDILNFLRRDGEMDGRIVGFLNILYRVGKIKTLGDIAKLNDTDVFLVDQFGEGSLIKLNRLLKRYSIPALKINMDNKHLTNYRRKTDLERKIIIEGSGMKNEYVLSVAENGSFQYHPNKCIF